jgi:hypothetical protein
MKWIFFMALLVFLGGCGLRQREIELNKKMNELNQREQQLNLREQSIDLKEEQLNLREQSVDSTQKVINDSLFLEHQKLPGKWTVEMQASETNCAGSAVGDIKNEQWDFLFQDDMVIVKAFSNKRLVRIYTGNYVGNSLRLTVNQDTSETSAKITVRLQKASDKEMTGEREIIQENGCRILYALRLKKQ